MFFLTGRRALPLRADGGSRRLRDARVVRAVAHARADDGEVPVEGACTRTRTASRAAAIRSCGSSTRSTAASPACATATVRLLEPAVHSRARAVFATLIPRRLRGVARARPLGRARTSSRRWTAASSSCTCARRPGRASKRPRRSATASKAVSATVIPARRDRQRHRQHRPAVQRHQPFVHELGADRIVGRGHPGRRWREDHRPTDDYVHDLRMRAGRSDSRACCSRSSRPTSSRRS